MANPNPDMSGLKPFKKGQSGNPGGKTSKHRKAEVKAAEKAAQLQLRLVSALAKELDKLEAGDPENGTEPNPTAAVGAIKGDVLRLLKDAQDRGFGAPVQPQEHTGKDGGAIETTDASASEIARRLAFLLASGVKEGE